MIYVTLTLRFVELLVFFPFTILSLATIFLNCFVNLDMKSQKQTHKDIENRLILKVAVGCSFN